MFGLTKVYKLFFCYISLLCNYFEILAHITYMLSKLNYELNQSIM